MSDVGLVPGQALLVPLAGNEALQHAAGQVGVSQGGGSYSVMSADTGSYRASSDQMTERTNFSTETRGASKVRARPVHAGCRVCELGSTVGISCITIAAWQFMPLSAVSRHDDGYLFTWLGCARLWLLSGGALRVVHRAHEQGELTGWWGQCAAQVRVVCSSNGVFVRQPSGTLEYEGGEIRLVNVSSASTLESLKEALDRVVSRNSQSKSVSGAPKASACPAFHLSLSLVALQ